MEKYSKQEFELAKKIREFEVNLLKEFKQGKIKGTIHCCIGQELEQVHIIKQLKKDDIITSNHRGHGHYLAYTEDFRGLHDELKGLKTGVNQGKSLSQHLHKDNFYMTGIQGGMIPIACGMAFAEKMKKSGNIVLCFIGDGTLGQGVLYESLNIASLWQLPIVFVVENNKYAMSTSNNESIAGSIKDRFKAFGLSESKGNIRGMTPAFKIIDAYRFCGHSGRDNKLYRLKGEEMRYLKRDKLGGYLCQDIM